MATTLLLQEDLEHLSSTLPSLVDGTNELFFKVMEDVSKTKARWSTFLQWHFLIESTAAAAYVMGMVILPLNPMHGFLKDYLQRPSMFSGPLAAVYLLLQILPLARFNRQFSACKHATESETMYRLMSQHEDRLEWRVFGVAITHNKIRAVMSSVVLSACSKGALYLMGAARS